MELWNTVIHAAILGTDKKNISEREVNDVLLPAFNVIQENGLLDKEEKFLQAASLAFNYRQSGAAALNREISMAPAPSEEKKYCSRKSMQVLQDIVSEENIPLLQLWLTHCNKYQQIVAPPFVPLLLTVGEQHKKLQPLISCCTGKRGAWLAVFNPHWNFGNTGTEEELWQTGTTDQRKMALQQVRRNDPALGLQWLQQTWQQEDAATRQSFLELLYETVNDADIAFLEGLVNDKSKKVKETALSLLKSIPGSAVVQQYQQALQQSVSLKQQKKLLGLSNTIQPEFHLTIPDESIYKTGIDKLSNNKELTDDAFILFQLAEHTPPAFWEIHLQVSKQQVIEYFQAHETGKKLIPALVNAIVRFKDVEWAKAFAQHSKVFYIDIIPLLPPAEQEAGCLQYMQQFPDSIVQYALRFSNEWTAALTKEIFNHTAKNTYQYNRSFYSSIIHLLPVQATTILHQVSPEQEYHKDHWNSMSAYITKLIQLKDQTIQYFNQ
ncbi:MAG: hypothetical protein KF862_08310 [Chitinophagaceae bacterium]|nr:hypothetical protein [Chitinophagaceae bacterium]